MHETPSKTTEDSGIVSENPTLVEADPERGFNYPYYLAVPEGFEDGDQRPILVEPHNVGEDVEEFQDHLDLARERIEGGYGRPIAEALGTPYLIPVFPRPFAGSSENPVDWTHMTHMLCARTMAIEDGPLERLDLQVLNMVDDARERLANAGYPLGEEFMLNGFSSQAAFVNRLAALHPERVSSVSAGGINGLAILPKETAELRGFGEQELEYPVGVANIEELTGEPFDLDSFRGVDQFLYMGAEDDKDALLFPDAWTDPELRGAAILTYGEDIHDERFPRCKSVYEEVDANAIFRLYEGKGHTVDEEIRADVIEFHERSLAGEDFDTMRADLGGNVD